MDHVWGKMWIMTVIPEKAEMRISDWKLILVILHMLNPLSHSSVSLLSLNGSRMEQAVPDSFYGPLRNALPRMIWENLPLPFGTNDLWERLVSYHCPKSIDRCQDSEIAAEAVASRHLVSKAYRVVDYNARNFGKVYSSQDEVKWFTHWCFISCWLLLVNTEVSYQADRLCPKTAWIMDAVEFWSECISQEGTSLIVHISLPMFHTAPQFSWACIIYLIS